MIIDGKAIAADILARAKVRATALGRTVTVEAIVTSNTPATASYLKIKSVRAENAGCHLNINRVSESLTKVFFASILEQIKDSVSAIIVQLPLRDGIDAKEVLDQLPVNLDADVLSSAARAKFASGDADALLPPVVGAIREIFATQKVEVNGKRAVVVGEGWLVGAPAAVWLEQQGAEITVLNSSSDLAALADADIIVSGAGVPHLIKPEMIKEGVVLIDAGTSESSGVLAGDADPACAAKCSVFTPVPGGVGPIAVACLFDNAVTLAERRY